MFDVILDYFKKMLKSRLFPITLIYLVLFGVIVNRLFVLQIINGPEAAASNNLKYIREREIKSTRGNIYDRNGELLATNQLSYSVVMQDLTLPDDEYNTIIDSMIKTIEGDGDTLDNDFYIKQNILGEFEFTVEGSARTRFLKNAFAYVLDDNGELKEQQKNATAEEVYEFLKNGTGNSYTDMFNISDDYTVDETLKIMGIRYALFCNYPKYYQITVASKVSEATVAAIKENSAELKGVGIEQQTSRVYVDSLYFAHIMGYTGLISAQELEIHEEDNYKSTDIIGKTGLEQEYEEFLAGKKGSETVTINNAGKVVEVQSRQDPVAGNDLYLTLDKQLQINVYKLLEKHITQILLSNIVPTMNYGSKGENASDIKIPIYEVYYALMNNNIININHFDETDAEILEKQTKQKFITAMDEIDAKYDTLLSIDNTTSNNKTGDMEDFLDYFYRVISETGILIKEKIPTSDKFYTDYKNDDISLSQFLQHALAQNWIDLSVLGIGEEYYSAEELYQKLVDYTKGYLNEDTTFHKMIYRDLIFSYKLSGREICLLLFDQGVLEYNEDEIRKLKNGSVSAYTFLTDKIRSHNITPGMLALEPYSGSVVITDIRTGEVRALVSYPSYDNNMLANKVDSVYYAKLMNDKARPMNNLPLTQLTAPGSTFKMVTTVAALEEGETTPTETIFDKGIFDKLSQGPKCHIYPGSHGSVTISEAIKVSCNYFFYEMGWRLSIDRYGKYDVDLGLSKLRKYASLFGLNETSGIELYEAKPHISDFDPVRSAIGQGSNSYTPVQLSRYVTTLANRGTCYNLTLLDMIKDKDGNIVKDNEATVSHDLSNISSNTWDTVLDGMYSVVNTAGGSVYNEFKNFDVTVAGKTGTSQISKVNPNNALFVSFAPYNNPEISVTAVIPNGYTSHNAAALTKDIYSYYFNLTDETELLNDKVTVNNNSGSALE